MGIYNITRPDGSQYEVDAESADQASKNLDNHLIGERKAASAKEFTDAPWYSKPAMITDDIVRNVAHGISAGWFDKGVEALTGQPGAETTKTQAAADRLGGLLTPASRAAGAMMLPSKVVPAVTAVGGGPLAKAAVGGAVAGGEGAAYGGAEAASQGEDIPTGIATGGIGGVVGQSVAQGVRGGVNAATKAIQGVNDVPPVRKMFSTGKIQNPTSKDYIDIATAKAEAKGTQSGPVAQQAAQKKEFGGLLTGKNRNLLTPTQKELMSKIVDPSPGEATASLIGKQLSDKLVTGGLGLGAGFGVSPLTGLLAAGGAQVGGAVLKRDAAKATQEAVDNLRRTVYRQKRFVGPLGARTARKAGQGTGYGAYDVLNDYLAENN